MPRKLLCSARAVASGAEEVEPGVRWIRASPARVDAAAWAGAGGATPPAPPGVSEDQDAERDPYRGHVDLRNDGP